jgi:hypothetical protein
MSGRMRVGTMIKYLLCSYTFLQNPILSYTVLHLFMLRESQILEILGKKLQEVEKELLDLQVMKVNTVVSYEEKFKKVIALNTRLELLRELTNEFLMNKGHKK